MNDLLEYLLAELNFLCYDLNYRLLGKFIYYLTRNFKFRAYLGANMKGAAGQQRVPSKFFKYYEVAFPKEISKQQTIIDYIDY